MNRIMLAGIMVLALFFAGCIIVNPPGGNGQVCTMDAKLCPDGSYVGRTGPNCEFAPCPGEGSSSGGSGGTSGCGQCPMYVPPHPDFCKEGVLVAGQVDECGCRAPPSCACTEEAKVCPDGSAVGRVPPNCEFAPCPGEGGGSTSGGDGSGTTGNADVDYLLAHKWNLISINGNAMGENPAYLTFNGNQGTFGGNAGCNYMSGAYTLDGDQINFGQTAITMMYCEENADLEAMVIGVIGGGPYKWEISGNRMNFYKGRDLVASWEGQAG